MSAIVRPTTPPAVERIWTPFEEGRAARLQEYRAELRRRAEEKRRNWKFTSSAEFFNELAREMALTPEESEEYQRILEELDRDGQER